MSPDPALVARTERLEHDVDPLALAGENGLLFAHPSGAMAGSRVATRISLPAGAMPAEAAAAVADVLGAIEVIDDLAGPGRGPVAFGALPFASPLAGELLVPSVLVGRDEDGTRWVTTVLPARAAPDEAHRAAVEQLSTIAAPATMPAGDALPSSFEVAAAMPAEQWCERVDDAVGRLQDGELRKVVLAREVVVRTDRPIARREVLERLRDTYPACMLFGIDGFVGATPELLVARHGDRVRSHPLAGTAPRSADAATDARMAGELRASTKNREEHRITIDMVHDTLLPYCSYLDEEAEPSIVPMANVQHLGTMVEGRLSSPPPSVLELALALHPTPAVGGWPRDDALSIIAELEPTDRGRYAGPVGWVDARGNGEWAVGIRSAEIAADGLAARVFAGVGIVADSDARSELAETRAKFQAMLSAIIRP